LNSRRRTFHDLFYKTTLAPYHNEKIKKKRNLKKIIQQYIGRFSDDNRKILLLLAIRNGSTASVKLLLGKKLDLDYYMTLKEFEQKSTNLMQCIPEKDRAIIAAQTNSLSAAFLLQHIPEKNRATIVAQTNSLSADLVDRAIIASLSADLADEYKENILLSPILFAQKYQSLQILVREASPVLNPLLNAEKKYINDPDNSLIHKMLNQKEKENIDTKIQELLQSHSLSPASSDTLRGHNATKPPPVVPGKGKKVITWSPLSPTNE